MGERESEGERERKGEEGRSRSRESIKKMKQRETKG